MKYFPYFVLILIVCVVFVMMQFNGVDKVSASQYDCLRIHILANSNNEKDQNVKLEVKSKIVDFLTPYLERVKTKEEAKVLVQENKDVIKAVVDNVLSKNGFGYKSDCGVEKKHFPTRYYENCLLEEGEYDALVVTLGEGKGDNWWCVVYPPLCFVNKNEKAEQNIIYNSRFLEIIDNFF